MGLLNAGASSVLGVDISSEMITQARAKAEALGSSAATFLCCDVAQVPPALNGTADVIYTGPGSLPWILDLGAWAAAISRLLKPDGLLFIFEGHPLANLWDRGREDRACSSGNGDQRR